MQYGGHDKSTNLWSVTLVQPLTDVSDYRRINDLAVGHKTQPQVGSRFELVCSKKTANNECIT